MSDNNITATDPQPTPQEPIAGNAYTPPATQEDLNRIIEGRLQRERSKYADYDALKEQAGKVEGLAADLNAWKQRAEAAEAKNATYEQEKQISVWAGEVAAETGVPAELLTGSTKEEMTAHAALLGKYINVAAPYVGSDGKVPAATPATSTRDVFAQALDGIL